MYKNILDVVVQIKPEDIDNICLEVSRWIFVMMTKKFDWLKLILE